MNTSLSHLPEQKQAELKAIKEALIPRYAEIEMVILFGSYARGTFVEDSYLEKGIRYDYQSDYDLLIILSKNGHANSDALTSSITARIEELHLPTPVNPIFHGVEFMNHELREGNYFFAEIKREGVLLFSTSRYQLETQREFSAEEAQAKAKEYFDAWFKSANMFYVDFESNMERAVEDSDHYKQAAFLLHQATERYYGAIQLVFTAYKPKTHDIEVLGKLAKALDMEFGKVFPRATVQERQRFALLKKAYVEARYNMHYTIGQADLDYLSERVGLLKSLTQEICQRKINSFTN